MTHQFPRQHRGYVERRYLRPKYPPLRMVQPKPRYVRGAGRSFEARFRAAVAKVDCLAAGRMPREVKPYFKERRRRDARERRAIEQRDWERLARQKPIVPAPEPYRPPLERVVFAVLLVWSAPTLWTARARPPKVPSQIWRASWTRYRLWQLVAAIYTLPLAVRSRLVGPVILDPAVDQPLLGRWYVRRYLRLWERVYGVPLLPFPSFPVPQRRVWVPGIAHMPTTWEGFATLAETTTTADPGTAGTSLAVTTRTPFPQQTWKQFWIVVQNSETDKTNREIMKVTAGHGTGGGSFTVVRGQEGTTGVAHASGSYVAHVLTATAVKNLKQNATGFFNVRDQFDARGDGSTDDLTPFNNAFAGIDSVPSFGTGGIVLVPPGTYRLSAAPTVPRTIHDGAYKAWTLRGPGIEQAVIQRLAPFGGLLFDLSGTITSGNVVTRQKYAMVQDITFRGWNDADMGDGSPLLRAYYVSLSRLERVHLWVNAGPALEGVEYQDCRVDDCWFDSCNGSTASNTGGTAVGLETIRLLGRKDNATSGTFGWGADTNNICNNVWFTNNEQTSGNASQAGVIVVSKNGGPAANLHRIYFTNNKIEGHPYTSDVAKLWNCRWIRFLNSDFTGYQYNGSSSISWINGDTAESVSIRGCAFDDENTASMTHTAMKVTGCTYWTVEDCVMLFGTPLAGDTTASIMFEFVGSANDYFYPGNISTSYGTRTSPLTTGTLPVNYFPLARFWNIRKTADQLLAGTGAQNITDLAFSSSANTDWSFQVTLFINNTASDTGGCKVAISVPAGATIKAVAFGPTTGVTAYNSALITASATLTTAFDTVASTPSWITIQGTIRIGATAGTVQMQAAEGTAADDITIQANSNLWAQKV